MPNYLSTLSPNASLILFSLLLILIVVCIIYTLHNRLKYKKDSTEIDLIITFKQSSYIDIRNNSWMTQVGQ